MTSKLKSSIFMILSSIFCIVSDILTRYFKKDINTLIFLRYGIAAIILFALKPSKEFINFKNIIRGILIIISLKFFTYGLNNLPLAIVIMVNFATPIWVTLLSKIFLKEDIKYKIIFCLLNILAIFICVKDVDTKDLLSILSIILASFFFASMDIYNKIQINLNEEINDIMIGLSFFSSLLIMPFGVYNNLTAQDLKIAIMISISSLLIFYFLLKASRYNNLSYLQPLKYIEFPLSVYIGYYVFNEAINNNMYLSFAIIILANILNYKLEK